MYSPCGRQNACGDRNNCSTCRCNNDLWIKNGCNIFNTNRDNVGVNMNAPLVSLDVSGIINASTDVTIDYVSIAPPVGSILAYTMPTSPSGWLICDGSEVSRCEYHRLFSVIGTTFGSGSGNDTFNLPNYQGAFLRGTGTQPDTNYSGPSANTTQNHATQTHNHNATTSISDPGHTHTQFNYNDDYNNNPGQSPTGFSRDAFAQEQYLHTTGNINPSTTGISASTVVSNSTLSVDPNETRPFNYGVYWLIKI